MVAGLCHQLAIERKNAGSTGNNTPTVLDKEALSRILEQGVLMGTANLFNDLPGFVEPAVIQALKPRIQMTPLCVESTQMNY